MHPRVLITAIFLGILTACSPIADNPALLETETLPAQAETAAPKLVPSVESAAPPAEIPNPSQSATIEPVMRPGKLAYVAVDGNVRLMNMENRTEIQVTLDGRSIFAFTPQESFTYDQPAWSSDGQFLAFLQTKYTPRMDSTMIVESLWIYDLQSGQSRAVLESENLNGYAWRPETHQLTYADTVAPNYFTTRGAVEAGLAKGIFSLDVDSGDIVELVPAEGFALVNPHWSPNGQIISFEEVVFMEGRGNFAYFDTNAAEYIRWDRPIGGYDWSFDSTQLVYDNLTYVPNGSESIFINNQQGTDERMLTSIEENTYVSMPRFSPDAGMVAGRRASLLEQGLLDTLMVVPVNGGEPNQLAELDEIGAILWSRDGKSILVVSGSVDNSTLVLVSLEGGEVTEIARGWQPAWQPLPGGM